MMAAQHAAAKKTCSLSVCLLQVQIVFIFLGPHHLTFDKPEKTAGQPAACLHHCQITTLLSTHLFNPQLCSAVTSVLLQLAPSWLFLTSLSIQQWRDQSRWTADTCTPKTFTKRQTEKITCIQTIVYMYIYSPTKKNKKRHVSVAYCSLLLNQPTNLLGVHHWTDQFPTS